MNARIRIFCLLLFLQVSCCLFAQGLKAFRLPNGLTVLIWEDESRSDVFGMVGVRTGSVNDPAEYTGLAHYLEHMMFKGTTQIGSLDWSKEEPLYKEIIALYDQMADATDDVQKGELSRRINQLTVEAGKLCIPNEYSDLMESIGAQGVNAATSFDQTVYYSSFPAYQVNKWLEISSQRFINPVFRSFQSELENVYEEYNRSQDNSSNKLSQFLMEKAFEGHPYARPIIGLPEHLKNPRLSRLVEFYDRWYTPENMVLVLVGNVNAAQLKRRIAYFFGRLESKPQPDRMAYPERSFKGRTQYDIKVGYYPRVVLVFQGVPDGHPDADALQLALSLISNSSQTGTLDKLVIEGELTSGTAFSQSFREQGRSMVMAMPLYDEGQQRFESNARTEKMMMQAIRQVAEGQFEDWKIEAIKSEMCREYDKLLESNEGIANLLCDAFLNGQDLSAVINFKEHLAAISEEEVRRVAAQYLSNDYLALYIEKGKEGKPAKIAKPGYEPVESPAGEHSIYATQFKQMKADSVAERFIDFSDVQQKPINDRSVMYYVPNTENSLYQLVLRYGAGTNDLPQLDLAAQLMNHAGVMGSYEPQQLKEELSKLNATCRVSATRDYLYIIMEGFEATLPQACQLLSRQILMPQLDDKQLAHMKGSIIGGRLQRKENSSMLNEALKEYLFFGEHSDYLTELTDKQILELKIPSLTGDINRASNYEAQIFYTGTIGFDQAYDILSHNLPLIANERESLAPRVRPMAQVKENIIYFLPNSRTEQAQIHLYIPMQQADKQDDVLRDAFNQYFGLDFTGLVLNEIREKRSMAYSAYAFAATQGLAGSASYLMGYVGTQNDKANEAVEVLMGLVKEMPRYPDRMGNIKSYLRQSMLSQHPNFRQKASYLISLKEQGYDDDPAKENLSKVDALTFDDMVRFYEQHIQGKPYAIAIMGNPKLIDLKRLEKLGKVVRISERTLFNTKDALF